MTWESFLLFGSFFFSLCLCVNKTAFSAQFFIWSDPTDELRSSISFEWLNRFDQWRGHFSIRVRIRRPIRVAREQFESIEYWTSSLPTIVHWALVKLHNHHFRRANWSSTRREMSLDHAPSNRQWFVRASRTAQPICCVSGWWRTHQIPS